MRFYPTTKLVRIGVTVLWCSLVMFYLVVALQGHRRLWPAGVFLLTASVQVATMWCNAWEVVPNALVQHGILYRKQFRMEDVTYAGPVRSRRLGRWLRRSIELNVRGLPYPLYVAVQERTAFLQAVREQAPHCHADVS